MTEDKIKAKCEEISDLLIRKNWDYGNSVFNPVGIFSKAPPIEALKVRIDDKLSRIASSGEKNFKEDTLLDLTGYLILLIIALEGEHDR
ncbi:MAG: hypothetical protein JW984_16175 [Deltaproteobacteria bacterium]|uniref:Nucleotide modification associated domain-containing protein n=1 Tax=Candidatus Zymogenus saltonus TaxID=2844893 RepID=A0A9D8KHG6_9DELT|nr:hypothetical protein [Candidatus Zymogenus saltonus]